MLGTYSLGMKQLAKLAQAIVHGPRLLILDEPTNGLDPPARKRMIRLIQEMRESGELQSADLLAPAARRGRDLRGGADSEAGPHRAHVEPGRGAPRQQSASWRLETFGPQDGFAKRLRSWACQCEAASQCHGGFGRIKAALPEGFEVCARFTASPRRATCNCAV